MSQPPGELGRKRSTAIVPHETFEQKKSRVEVLGRQFLNSFAGDDTAGNNHARNALLCCLESDFTEDQVEFFLRFLQYRMELMAVADTLVEILDLKAPDGKRCSEFDVEAASRWKSDVDATSLDSRDFVQLIYRNDRNILFPKPIDTEVQGRPYSKPPEYLAIAFQRSGLSLDEAERIIIAVVHEMEQDVKVEARSHRRATLELKAKRRKFYGNAILVHSPMFHPTGAILETITALLDHVYAQER